MIILILTNKNVEVFIFRLFFSRRESSAGACMSHGKLSGCESCCEPHWCESTSQIDVSTPLERRKVST